MDTLSTFYSKCGKYRVRIGYCEEKILIPNEDGFFDDCKMFLASRNFFPDGAERLAESRSALKKRYKYAIPIYAYSHGGITIRDTPFSCSWDSGHIGFCCSDDEKKARAFIKAWDDYMNEPAYDAVLEEKIALYTEDGAFYCEEWREVESIREYPSERDAFDCIAPKDAEFEKLP